MCLVLIGQYVITQGDHSGNDVDELIITDTSYDVLLVIMSYLYDLGNVKVVKPENAIEVLITAEKYGLDELKLWCEKLIISDMEVRHPTENRIGVMSSGADPFAGMQLHNVPYFLQLSDTYHAAHLRRYCLELLTARYDQIEALIRSLPDAEGTIEQQLESDELRQEVLSIVHEKRRKRADLAEEYEDLNEKIYNNTVMPNLINSRQPLFQASLILGGMVGVAAAWAFLADI